MVFSPLMNLALIGFFSFFISLTCAATSFSGYVISIEKDKYSILLADNFKKFPLVAVSMKVQVQLNRLKSGDFLSAEGFTNDKKDTLFVSSVNHVGLQDLIGNWTGDDDYCYKFKDFYTMNIFNKNDRNKCDFKMAKFAREFSYFVNPSNDNWSVLLSDSDDSYLMDLTLKSKYQAELSLYDSKSGDILRQIKIRR